MRIVQYCRDTEVVKAAVDGLNLVQVIDLAKGAFGVEVKVAQVIHEALLLALEIEPENIVPVHLEQHTCKRKSPTFHQGCWITICGRWLT